MSKYLDTSNKTQVDQIMAQCGRSSRSSWAKSVRSSFLDYYRKCNPRVFFLENGWEKVPNWECFSVNREKRLFLSVHVIDCQNGRKETKSGSNVEDIFERRWFARTNIILWPCLFGLHSARMQNKLRYGGQLQGFVWIWDTNWRKINIVLSVKSEANIS